MAANKILAAGNVVDAYGSPVIELAHSCDNPHKDVFVRLSE